MTAGAYWGAYDPSRKYRWAWIDTTTATESIATRSALRKPPDMSLRGDSDGDQRGGLGDAVPGVNLDEVFAGGQVGERNVNVGEARGHAGRRGQRVHLGAVAIQHPRRHGRRAAR